MKDEAIRGIVQQKTAVIKKLVRKTRDLRLDRQENTGILDWVVSSLDTEGKFLLTRFPLSEPVNFLLFLGPCEGSHNYPPHASGVKQPSESCKPSLPFKISHGRHGYNTQYRKDTGKTSCLKHFSASNSSSRTVSAPRFFQHWLPVQGLFSIAELAGFVLLHSYFRWK